MSALLYLRPNSAIFIASVSVLLAAGCGGKGPPKLATVPATGTVTYNGQGIEGAMITFVPVDVQSGKSASATTDAQGKFSLKTYVAGATEQNGALPGDYKVTVSKVSSATSVPAPTFNADSGPAATTLGDPNANAAPTNSLPDKYANPESSGLTATVKSSGNEPFTFALSDQ